MKMNVAFYFMNWEILNSILTNDDNLPFHMGKHL